MFSFQGDFKRQRNINLGGRRRNDTARDTAEAVLSKAHEERQRREKERLQHAAALTIQRMWRERHSTAVWRQRMRDRMDMSAVDNPQAPAERLFGSLADFAVHCNGSAQDIDRLHAILLALFLRPADGPRYQRIVAAAAAATQLDGDKWLALALRLFGSALAIPADGVLRVNRDLVIDSLVSAVRADTVVHAGGQPLLRGLVESRGLYAFLSRCLSGDRGLVANVEGAVQLAVAPAGSAALAAAAMPRFVRWILTIPGLPSQIGVRGVTAITRAHIDWIKVARCICDEVAWQQGRQGWHEPGDESPRLGVLASRAPGDAAPQLAAISMLGNMAAFVLPQLSRQGPLTPIDKGFIEACAACVRVVPSGDLLGAKRSSAPAGQARAADAQAQRWLNSVLSVTALGLLVRASCADGPDGDSTHARLAQELLLVFIQRWGKTASSAVINSIFQAVDIRTVGWREVLRDPGFLEHFAGDRARVDAIRAYDLAKLQLLCALLSRQLETIGDDELFQQGMSLPLADIRTVARVCRNIAFALLWSHVDSGDLVHLRDSAAALTRQLFALNARHPFVEEDFWLVPPSLLDMASFADKVAEDPMFSAEGGDAEGGDAEGGDAEDAESDSSGVDDADHSSDEADPAPGLDNIIDILLAGDQVPGSRQDWMMHTYSSFVRQRQRQQRAEQLVMRPRIAVLRRIPFVVPFNDRVRLFHALINRDRARLGIPPIGRVNGPSPFDAHTAAHAVVRRGNVFNDGFSALFPALSGKPARTRPVGAAAGSGLLPGTGSDASPARVPFPDRDMMFPVRPPGPSQVRDLFEESPDFFRMPMMDEIGSPIRSPISQRDMFKYRIQISFVDEHGMPEAGVDGGGVFKEFLTSLVREAFDPRMGLFCATRSNNIYPDPDSVLGDDEHRRLVLEKYKFLGAVIGKALYEGVLVDAPFALFFLGYCVGKLPEFNDLPTLDEDLYRGLVALKNYPTGARAGAAAASKRGGGDGGEGDEDDEIYKVFGLDFTTTVGLRGGQTKTVPLVPRGDTIRVTSHNRLLYLDLVAQHKLVKQIGAQVRAFVAGLHTVIPENWLRLLFASPLELSRLLCGDAGVIDVADWQRNTLYSGAFGDQGRNHPTVQAFWSVVEHELSEAQRRELCRFATSCERPPLLGFAELNPQFCISGTSHANEDGSSIETRLPSASTCVNLLKLPAYRSRQVLHDKLVTAIDSHAGFDLS